jgi:hypothetical protein
VRSAEVPRQSRKYLPVAGVAAAGGLFAASPALAGVDISSGSGALVRFGGSIPAGARAHVEAVWWAAVLLLGVAVVAAVLRDPWAERARRG